MYNNNKENTRTSLITGASGYVGQRLALFLAEHGEEVHVLIRNPSAKKYLNHPSIRIFLGDIEDIETIRAAIRGCDHVYHVAGLARLNHPDPDLFYRINVHGTRNVLDSALEAGVKKIVFTSSTGVIGPSLGKPMRECDPRIVGYDNDYEVSKQIAETLVIEYNHKGLPGVIASPSRVYGPGVITYGSGVNRFIHMFLKKQFAFVPFCDDINGNYAYIDDVIQGHLLAMRMGRNGEKYILGGENVSFKNFMLAIRQGAGGDGRFIKVPKTLIKVAAATTQAKAWAFNQVPELTPKVVDRLFLNFSFSSEKAISELGYSITPFDEGIRRTISYLRNGSK